MDELTPTEKRLLAEWYTYGVSTEKLVSITNINTTYARKCIERLKKGGYINAERPQHNDRFRE